MRRSLLALLVVIVVLAGVDLTRPADRQISTRAALAGLTVYQATLSRVYAGLGVRCRFEPTCSHYAAASLRQHGFLEGSRLAVRRVMRCGPWTPAGTIDPPPGPARPSGA